MRCMLSNGFDNMRPYVVIFDVVESSKLFNNLHFTWLKKSNACCEKYEMSNVQAYDNVHTLSYKYFTACTALL